MTYRKPDPTPIEAFLAPLAALALKQSDIEALVFWGGDGGWDTAPSEALESEEIAFYAEGLLQDGFHMVWTVVALAETPALADHVRLQFWQDDAPPPEGLPEGWVAVAAGRWPPG
ncbi:hypothetical protein [Tabrizicola sp. BL-A-41-H6]|uniref:hypothetical protein n=1 Tax=Tabrizicola sp. BL-A-41-H6 TaxID=3421107 RepID=UPI003D674720